jgi:hypothetical protein
LQQAMQQVQDGEGEPADSRGSQRLARPPIRMPTSHPAIIQQPGLACRPGRKST